MRFGDGSACRTPFGGDFERLAGAIRCRCLVMDERTGAVAGGRSPTDRVVFDFVGS